MALFHVHFFSESLGLSTSMNVILPQAARGQIGLEGNKKATPLSTLYLLHGLSDDHSIWLRRTSIERYVSGLPLAVVMPEVGRSFYHDMAHGLPYWTFLSEELPSLVQQFFNLPSGREHTFVAGLSMGGYGAFRLALSHPGRYAAAASLSGALDLVSEVENNAQRLTTPQENLWTNVLGEKRPVRNTGSDLFHLVSRLVEENKPCPALYQGCGTDDFLYEQNVAFRKHAKANNLPLTYQEGPGGHEWGYWDTQIQKVLQWLPLPP